MDSREKRSVMIVDDSIEHQELLRILLESEGLEVHSAMNGLEALETLEKLATAEQLPDLILLDLMMPVMDGYAFRVRQIQSPSLANIPIVVMSASAFVEEQTRRMNATACIKKPVDIEELLRLLQTMLTNDRGLPPQARASLDQVSVR